jgi:hypothetical protein
MPFRADRYLCMVERLPISTVTRLPRRSMTNAHTSAYIHITNSNPLT